MYLSIKIHLRKTHYIMNVSKSIYIKHTLYNEPVKFPIYKTQILNLSNSIYAKRKQNINYTMNLSKLISKAEYISI